MSIKFNPRIVFCALLLILLALVPLYAALANAPFYLSLFNRILVFAIAALSLNLILGYGGMVSFGHALYFGVGAYAVGILSSHGWGNGWLHLGVAVGVCALLAVLTGMIALRTSGIAFIMITLAFSQMLYFLFVSLKQYGGDDGLAIAARSDIGLVSLTGNTTFYYLCYGVLLLAMFFCHRLVHARFGMVLRASKSNQRRMLALGYAAPRYRLAAYVIAAVACGVAGVLYANLTLFVAPSYLSWTMSGDFIIMVMLGGAASVAGPVLGAVSLILLEEACKAYTDHWMMIMGALIVLIVLLTRRGIHGLLLDWELRAAASETAPVTPAIQYETAEEAR